MVAILCLGVKVGSIFTVQVSGKPILSSAKRLGAGSRLSPARADTSTLTEDVSGCRGSRKWTKSTGKPSEPMEWLVRLLVLVDPGLTNLVCVPCRLSKLRGTPPTARSKQVLRSLSARQRTISASTSYVETGLGQPPPQASYARKMVHRIRELWLDEMEHISWILDARR